MLRVPLVPVSRIATTSRELTGTWAQLLVEILVCTSVSALGRGPSFSFWNPVGYTAIQTLVALDIAWKSKWGSWIHKTLYLSLTLCSVANCMFNDFLVFCCQILSCSVFCSSIIGKCQWRGLSVVLLPIPFLCRPSSLRAPTACLTYLPVWLCCL